MPFSSCAKHSLYAPRLAAPFQARFQNPWHSSQSRFDAARGPSFTSRSSLDNRRDPAADSDVLFFPLLEKPAPFTSPGELPQDRTGQGQEWRTQGQLPVPLQHKPWRHGQGGPHPTQELARILFCLSDMVVSVTKPVTPPPHISSGHAPTQVTPHHFLHLPQRSLPFPGIPSLRTSSCLCSAARARKARTLFWLFFRCYP